MNTQETDPISATDFNAGKITELFSDKGHYGSRVTIKDSVAVADEQIRMPTFNKNHIQTIAITKGSTGEADIRDYSTRQFDEVNAELLEKCRRLIGQVMADVGAINSHINELSQINARTDRYCELTQKGIPWTKFAKIQVVILAVFSLVLLGVGINTVAQVLLASGVPGFDNPWRCYLFSLTPIGIAFAFKSLRTFVPEARQKMIYTVIIWACGLVFGILWTILFASTFPALTQSASDIINSINSNSAGSSSGHGNILFIIASILAESLLAAGCWLTIEAIVEKHQPSVRVANPAYARTQTDLDHWLKRKYEQLHIAGKIKGKMDATESARKRFVEDSVGLFRTALGAAGHGDHLSKLFNG